MSFFKSKKERLRKKFTEGKLWQYISDINIQAQHMFDTLVEQMKEVEGVTEQLKEENQLEWVCRMQNIEARIMEIVSNHMIYI